MGTAAGLSPRIELERARRRPLVEVDVLDAVAVSSVPELGETAREWVRRCGVGGWKVPGSIIGAAGWDPNGAFGAVGAAEDVKAATRREWYRRKGETVTVFGVCGVSTPPPESSSALSLFPRDLGSSSVITEGE